MPVPIAAVATALAAALITTACGRQESTVTVSRSYSDLIALFDEWRAFAAPHVVDGVPDYSQDAMRQQHVALADFLDRVDAFDTSSWSVAEKVDLEVMRAEMKALDFNHRVLRPWERDPAFYVMIYPSRSDTPAREGPVIHTAIDAWKYDYPLSTEAATELAERFNTVAPLYEAARGNLTGNTRDLFVGGVHSMQGQIRNLERYGQRVTDAELREAVDRAREATVSFAGWLEEQAQSKTGHSGIGKDNYNWYLRHVQLVPYTWDDEVAIMKRELARAHSYLRLVENKNRRLPPLERFSSPEQYDREMDRAVDEFFAFLEEEEILTVKPYMEPEMRRHLGSFVPADGLRSFFSEVNYRDAMPMRAHLYHWIEIARIENEPLESPIRRSPHLYNIFAGRSEGLATAFEEMMLAAGLFDDRPRADELIYIMLAQRAARALGGLYMHGGEMTMEEASLFAAEWTPRGWLPKDSDLMKFEQHLYLRQPFYGTSYVTGKVEIDKLIKDVAHKWGDQFTLKLFMDELNMRGVVPVSLIRWEMTGDGGEVEALLGGD